MLASPLPQDDHLTLSYIRQPGEEAEVIAEAFERLGQPLVPRADKTTWYLMVGILGGAALSLFLNIYRSLILLPAFGLTPLIDVSNLILICLAPCLSVYVLMTLYLRREAHLQRTAMMTRIRPDVTVTVMVTPDGIAWETSCALVRLGWSKIADIEDRNGRIEFDCDATVHYIPAHAFHNQQEQAAFLERVRRLWQPLDPAKP
jgi:hypothetical protein